MTTKERLEENEIEDGAVYFDHPEFPDSIIGTTFDTPARVVYDYNLMVEEYAKKQGVTTEEAEDFISYNCLRSLSYLGSSAPIIMFPLIDRGDWKMPTEDELEQQLLENLGLLNKNEQTESNDNKNKQKAGDQN